MNIILANPRGFCAGVDRAIEIVERALELFGAPVYVRHEVVHNRYVVNELREKGAVFVEELGDVPDDCIVIFSAHGVSLDVREEAAARNLRIFDATCPLVTKVHMEVARHCREQREVILIGHSGHPEVEGTMGQYRVANDNTGKMHLVENIKQAESLEVDNSENLAFVTQTTLSVDDSQQIVAVLQRRFPSIIGPRKDDICYATQNRQDAAKQLSEQCDLMLVVGSVTSSNSNRLKEIASGMGVEAYLIDAAEQIKPEWLNSKTRIGVTAGASAPEILVQQVVEFLKNHGAIDVTELTTREENVTFSLPRGLKNTH
ncbi:MAG: 4-hydroxy-3-methylbut-2-enyl diphosphate reductase [Gammaproteobacteria bacterium]|nr:4-hydroxy-3-methylbut-2-enyl diphosphate reductase [Gammaproteobacteria bacterium]